MRFVPEKYLRLVFNLVQALPLVETSTNKYQVENLSKPMIESLYEENFAQGRLERTLNLPVTPVMDEETVSNRKKVCYS